MEKAQSSSGAKVYDVEKIASVIVKKALYVLAGYLSGLCVLPFGACPFGVALLAAADRNSLFAYLGLVLSCFVGFEFQTGILLIGV